MGSVASKVGFAAQVIKSVGAYMIYGWSENAYIGDSEQGTASSNATPTFLDKGSLRAALSKFFEGRRLEAIKLVRPNFKTGHIRFGSPP